MNLSRWSTKRTSQSVADVEVRSERVFFVGFSDEAHRGLPKQFVYKEKDVQFLEGVRDLELQFVTDGPSETVMVLNSKLPFQDRDAILKCALSHKRELSVFFIAEDLQDNELLFELMTSLFNAKN